MLASLSALAVLILGGVATPFRARKRARTAEARWPAEGEMVTIGGVAMHVVVRGVGRDVVLIHGASGSVRDFTYSLADSLAQSFRVFAVDRLGHGWSGTCADSDTLATQAQMVRQAVAVMGAARPIVLGHSYGAAVALRWAIDAPSTVAGLVTVAPVSHPWNTPLPLFYRITSHPLLRGIVNPLIAAWAPLRMIDDAVAQVFSPDAVPDGYIRHFGPAMSARTLTLIENARQRRSLRGEITRMSPSYGKVRLPVEIVHGSRDTTVGLDHHGLALLRDLPNARLTVVTEAGHMPHHADEAAVIAAVRRLADDTNETIPAPPASSP